MFEKCIFDEKIFWNFFYFYMVFIIVMIKIDVIFLKESEIGLNI